MQFSESWLRTLVNPALDSKALCHLLTMAGLEVEEQRACAPAFSQVIVAQVISAEKHPDADKLKLCRVDIGATEPLQIVCGAPNVAPGLKVPCALVGAKLPGISIKKAKVRGIESFGMLCSARELGMTEDDQGGLLILADDAPVGMDIRTHLDLDDQCIEIKLTPNRADCLSLAGIAREVAALTDTSLQLPESVAIDITHAEQRTIHLEAPAACPRYCGRVLLNVNAAAATPDWMQRRLERSGIRSISAIVDVTNYVMLELGQPLHAFDNQKLAGDIQVRMAQAAESLQLLNEQQLELNTTQLVIADLHGPQALAGIMGGLASGVTTTTRDIFLESAFFAPAAIAGKARELGFSSDASYRFERGVDFQLPRRALERASQLILEICGGQAGPITEALAENHLPQRPPLRLRAKRARKLLGIPLATAEMARLLRGLGLTLEENGEELIVTPPSQRFDLMLEADLIEEIARLYGYDNIPSPAPQGRLAMLEFTEHRRPVMSLRHQLAERGYFEVVNYSFVDSAWEQDFCANQEPVRLANPIASQMNVMRTSLLGGLVQTLAYNLKRRTNRVRVFEIGRCFLAPDAQGHYPQPQRLGGLCAGPAMPLQWGEKARNVDFYDVKADIETLFAADTLTFITLATHPALHPGRAASLQKNGQTIGYLGELHPAWVQKYNLTTAPIVFELELDALIQQALPCYQAVSRFPSVERDLALLVDQKQALAPLRAALQEAAPAIVKSIELFDIYQGKGIAENKKSLAFRVVMQDTEATLADADVEQAMTTLLKAAEQNFAAGLRA